MGLADRKRMLFGRCVIPVVVGFIFVLVVFRCWWWWLKIYCWEFLVEVEQSEWTMAERKRETQQSAWVL